MKNFALASLFILFYISSFAQTDNWYFSFSMGKGMPMGSFSKTSGADPDQYGFAKNGFALLLDATYPMDDHWGLKGMVLVNTNPVDRKGLGTMLEQRIPSSISIAAVDQDNLSLQADSWMWNAMMIGTSYTLNFDRIYWDFQLLGGLNVIYLPQQKLSYESITNNWFYLDQNTTSHSVSAGVMAGTALRFPMSDRFNLKVGIDYFNSRAKVKYEQLKVTDLGASQLSEKLAEGHSTVAIHEITGTIGFVYYLQ